MRLSLAFLSAALVCLVLSTGAVDAATKPTRTAAERADAKVQPAPDEVLTEVSIAVAMGLRGEYGSLSQSEKRRLRLSHDRIVRELQGAEDIGALPREARIVIYNAQQNIESILNANDTDRMVCTHRLVTGTRLKKTECLSIADREARTRASVRTVDSMMRVLCDPSQGSRCALGN